MDGLRRPHSLVAVSASAGADSSLPTVSTTRSRSACARWISRPCAPAISPANHPHPPVRAALDAGRATAPPSRPRGRQLANQPRYATSLSVPVTTSSHRSCTTASSITSSQAESVSDRLRPTSCGRSSASVGAKPARPRGRPERRSPGPAAGARPGQRLTTVREAPKPDVSRSQPGSAKPERPRAKALRAAPRPSQPQSPWPRGTVPPRAEGGSGRSSGRR